MAPALKPVTYHCQDPDKPMGTALCGMYVPKHAYQNTYDYPEDFFVNNSYRAVRCTACMTHPDVPMLTLGAMP